MRALATLAAAALLVSACAARRARGLAAALEDWPLEFPSQGLALRASEAGPGAGRRELEAASPEGLRLLAAWSKPADPAGYLRDRRLLLESLFDARVSPYPEAISNTVACPERFRPDVREGPGRVEYRLAAGERLNYGVCADDLVRFRSIHVILDCGGDGVVEASLFSPDGRGLEERARGLRCRR